MNLVEITETLHGESPFQGYPCTLVRLAGCNLKCSYCDTDSTEKFKMPVEKVIQVLKDSKIKEVLITGGEPLLQMEDVLTIVEQAQPKRYVIETNGSILIPEWPIGRPIVTVLDCKLHDNLKHFNILNLKRIVSGDIVKFIFWDDYTFDMACEIIKNNHSEVCSGVHWVFSPTYDILVKGKMGKYAERIIEIDKNLIFTRVSFQIQLHKILGVV